MAGEAPGDRCARSAHARRHGTGSSRAHPRRAPRAGDHPLQRVSRSGHRGASCPTRYPRVHVKARDIASSRGALEVRSRDIGRRNSALAALIAAVVCSAVVLGLQWAQWRDAASATTRFERGSAQVSATVGRGLAAPIYMGRINSLLDGHTDIDSATLAHAAGSLPSNGLLDALGVAVVQGDRVVMTATMPAPSPALPVGLDLAATPTHRQAFDLAR